MSYIPRLMHSIAFMYDVLEEEFHDVLPDSRCKRLDRAVKPEVVYSNAHLEMRSQTELLLVLALIANSTQAFYIISCLVPCEEVRRPVLMIG